MTTLGWVAAAGVIALVLAAVSLVAILLRDRRTVQERTGRADAYLASLRALTADIQYTASADAAAVMMVNQLAAQPGISGALVLLDGGPGAGMRIAARAGEDPGDPVTALDPDGERLCRALHSGTNLTSPGADRAHACVCPVSQSPGGGILCVPLHNHGRVSGLLIARAKPERLLTPALSEHVETVASIGSITLAGTSTRDSAMRDALHDGLTGIYNRRYLEAALSQTMHLMTRLGQPISVIMMDLDGFKGTNDRWGHQAGDRLLQRFAACIVANVREGDVVARYGGDEFVAVMPNTPLVLAREVAERILAAVRALSAAPAEGPAAPEFSVSIGVVCAPDHGWEMDDMLRAADAALYRAKRDGRNRVAEFAVTDERTADGARSLSQAAAGGL